MNLHGFAECDLDTQPANCWTLCVVKLRDTLNNTALVKFGGQSMNSETDWTRL